jgi:hypothetical protein
MSQSFLEENELKLMAHEKFIARHMRDLNNINGSVYLEIFALLTWT